MGIPGYIYLGNVKANEAARLSHNMYTNLTILGFSYADAKKYIKNHTSKVWQHYW
jgi:hypothetical protein